MSWTKGNLFVGTVLTFVMMQSALNARADDKMVRRVIKAVISESIAAAKQKDVKGMYDLAAPDAMFTDHGKTYTLRQQEASTRRMFALTKTIKQYEVTLDEITVHGNQAIVIAHSKLVSALRAPGGKGHILRFTRQMKELWIKSAQGWKMKRDETIDSSTSLDGRPTK